jgi:2-keto-4-pentenoate hydratase
MDELICGQLALTIAEQHRRRENYVPLAKETKRDVAFGYEVQEQLIRLWEPCFGAVRSWKVGLTTTRMQEMCGVDQPIAGAVFASRVHASPAELDHRQFVRVGIEAELALRISSTPEPGRALSAARMRNHVDAVCAAFEIVDDRAADYATLDAVSMVADNSWNAGIVLGTPVPLSLEADLLNLEGRLFRNGDLIETGLSLDAGGDPLNIVAWLATALAARGRCLETGQWVMTGSIVRTQFPTPGDAFQFRLGDLPPAEARII